MKNEQILNLTDVEPEDFKAIEAAVEDWKASGLCGNFSFVSDVQEEEAREMLTQIFQKCYNKGVIAGGIAAFAGIGIGVGIGKTYSYFKNKKEKKVR